MRILTLYSVPLSSMGKKKMQKNTCLLYLPYVGVEFSYQAPVYLRVTSQMP